MKVMMHVQHLLGIGHQTRAASLARAFAACGMQVLYVSGGFPVPGLQLGGARLVQLPPARTGDRRYSRLVDATGSPVDGAWEAARRDRLLEVCAREKPEVLLVETFPFGRKLLAFELVPLLECAARMRPRPKVLCSVRDIVEPRSKPRRYEEMRRQAEQYFDWVLVHSDPAIIPFETSFPVGPALSRQLYYTGFVWEPPPLWPWGGRAGEGDIVVSAGGGAVGGELLGTAMQARAVLSAMSSRSRLRRRIVAAHWRLLSGTARTVHGSGLSKSRALTVEPNRSDFPRLLGRCQVSVSQAGYNTDLDILRARCRAVVVPYAEAGQLEQGLRAQALAQRGLLQHLPATSLAPSTLAAAIERAARTQRPGRQAIDFSGARNSAAFVARLAMGEI